MINCDLDGIDWLLVFWVFYTSQTGNNANHIQIAQSTKTCLLNNLSTLSKGNLEN